jgi:hypothetical protein
LALLDRSYSRGGKFSFLTKVRLSDIFHFFGWLSERYLGWPMPHRFFSVKAVTGRRLDSFIPA